MKLVWVKVPAPRTEVQHRECTYAEMKDDDFATLTHGRKMTFHEDILLIAVKFLRMSLVWHGGRILIVLLVRKLGLTTSR